MAAAGLGASNRIPRLFSGVDAHVRRLTMPLDALDRQAFAQGLERARAQADPEDWRTQWEAGRALSLPDLIGMLTGDVPADQAAE